MIMKPITYSAIKACDVFLQRSTYANAHFLYFIYYKDVLIACELCIIHVEVSIIKPEQIVTCLICLCKLRLNSGKKYLLLDLQKSFY